MRRQILKRAIALFLISAGLSAAAIGLMLWHQLRLAGPCSAEVVLNAEPVACYYRVYYTGLDDWPLALTAALIYFLCCLLVAWLSLKRGLPSRTG